MGKLGFVLVAVPAGASGRMSVPARYRQPLQVYEPRVDRLAVAGCSTTEYEAVDGRVLNDATAMRCCWKTQVAFGKSPPAPMNAGSASKAMRTESGAMGRAAAPL